MSIVKYNYEIQETSPRASQPTKIKVDLKMHQLACLYKAIQMETTGTISYAINQSYENDDKTEITVKTNIGILGDIVGYGKTLTALAIIASNDTDNIHYNDEMNESHCGYKNYSYISVIKKNKNIIYDNNIINSTLIIVPRGPVYIQWKKALEAHTTFKYLAIENLNFIKKHLPNTTDHNDIINFFNQYDVVLIKNTTLDTLISWYDSVYCPDQNIVYKMPIIKRWKRIMIDEAHDISQSTSLFYYQFLWLISGTYENITYTTRCHRSMIYNMKDAFNHETHDLIVVKCAKEFVKKSFRVPAPIEKYYLCKMPARINAIKNFICKSVLDKINANDISGAIKDLGGKADTKENIIELVSNEIKREIQNKEIEKEYVNNLNIPNENKILRIKTIEKDIEKNNEKLKNLTDRITELNTKMCAICMYDIENPFMLECTHSYCAQCIVRWISNNMKCPECRNTINTEKIISVMKEITTTENEISNQNSGNKIMDKIDTLLSIIEKNPSGKYLLFSKYDSGFYGLMRELENKNISCSEMKGNTSHMVNVLEKFRKGEINVILLNTNFAGSGIDINCATDVIIFHSMGLDKFQAIGRAQRVGRTDSLNIHYLYYEHEMNIRN